MPQIILNYNLNDGVTKEQFEEWVRTFDQPNMRSLSRVSSFRTFSYDKLLMGEGAPRFQYLEVFEINDLEGFLTEDMAGEIVQKVMSAFMPLVKDVEFAIANEV